jgi:integrase/recombinase XerD
MMTALRQRMIEDMRLRNFSPHTQEAYVRAVATFALHFKQSPQELTAEHVRQYLLHMVQERRVSWGLYNQTRCPSHRRPRITPDDEAL